MRLRLAGLTLLLPLLGGAHAFSAPALPAEAEFTPLLWHLRNSGQPWRMEKKVGQAGRRGADIHIDEAWSIIDAAPDVVVAVIDGGFELSHPDLKSEILANKAYSFLTRSNKMSPVKDEVHGNLVMGVIGANGFNRIGITGVSRHCKMLPIEAIPGGDQIESDQDVANAILYATKEGARVINCSFGKRSTSAIVRAAIQTALENNVLIVTGAGNDGVDVDQTPFWPGAYSKTFENVINVAGTDRDDDLWSSTNYGKSVDVAAPGSEIFSTGNSSAPALGDVSLDYFTGSGTSLAAPIVSGVAALMIELDPQLRAKDIKRILTAAADPRATFKGKVKSGGRLNAATALKLTLQFKKAK